MNPQNELFDAIENYLNEGMSEQERFAFEERMSQDQSLADKVAEVRASNEAIYYASLAELKTTIGKDLKNIKYKEPVKWKKVGTITAISVAIVASLTTYFILTDTSTVESDKNDLRSERTSESNDTSNSSKEKSVTTSVENESSITKESAAAYSNNQHSITTDTVVKKHIIEQTVPLENKIQNNPVSNTPKLEVPVLNENKIACDKSFTIHTQPSCKEKETGSISIVSDGAYTYTYQIEIQSKTGSKGLFPNLSAGVYDLQVTYGKECTYKKKINVEEKWCAMNDAYSFNPDYNEKWKPVYEAGASGTILIYDRQGKEMYNMPFGSGNEEWIGNDKQGMPVAVGVYLAIITYSDGRKEKVELTIVR